MVRYVSLLTALLTFSALAAGPAKEGLAYGEASGVTLTMDYYAASGRGPHPIVIIIHGGGYISGTSKNGSEAYCADFLAPAGYAVFSINYRLAPRYPYPAALEDVVRAIRYLRFHAPDWEADPHRIALVGGSAGGYLSNMAGLINAPGAEVQAVVTLFGPSDFRGKPLSEHQHAFLDSAIQEKGAAAALSEASPIVHVTKNAPPFLLIHGDKDEAVPFSESLNLQAALRAAGVRCDLIRIPNGPHATGSWHRIPGVPDWERRMTEWLNKTLHHEGPVGQGIRAREAS